MNYCGLHFANNYGQNEKPTWCYQYHAGEYHRRSLQGDRLSRISNG